MLKEPRNKASYAQNAETSSKQSRIHSFLSGKKRAGLSLYYVLKYVGEIALSGLPRFSAASLFRAFSRPV